MKRLSIVLATLTIGSLLVSSCTSINSLKSRASSIIAPSTSVGLWETYTVYGINSYNQNLYTIQSWSGSGNKTLSFTSTQTPMVIDFGYTPTSNIASSLDLNYQGGNNGGTIGSQWWAFINWNGQIIEGTGAFKIAVTSSGCNWWIKIGVEQDNASTNVTTSAKKPFGTYTFSTDTYPLNMNNGTFVFNGNTVQFITSSGGLTTTITYTFQANGIGPTGDYLFSTIIISYVSQQYVPQQNVITIGTAGAQIDYDAVNDRVTFADNLGVWYTK